MTALATIAGTIAIATAGALLILGARRLAWRVLAIGAILLVTNAWLNHPQPPPQTAANVANR